MKLNIIILAAGLGKRMCSTLPKVLHPIGGKPMLSHLLETVQALSPQAIYVVQNALLPPLSSYFSPKSDSTINIKWVTQTEQLGTANAVQAVMPYINSDLHERVLILCGDTPLISVALLKQLLADQDSAQDSAQDSKIIGFVSTQLDKPTGFGRVIRDAQNQVTAIVEEKEATEAIRAISEINTGIFLASASALKKLLPHLDNQNHQKEYYLTDMVKLGIAEGIKVFTTKAVCSEEVLGVNTRVQQAMVERFYQKNQVEKLMAQGVSILDPQRVDIRGKLICDEDVTIEVNTIFEGQVKLGARTKIGANSILINCDLAEDVEILPFSYVSGAKIGKGCQIGPYARIRPETCLDSGVKIGNFVEVKKSHIGPNSKINHLSYIGDAKLGAWVNVGAGTITCNYDGISKHKTIIENNVHIGSDTQLIAPVLIREGTTIAAGSTITKDTQAGKLTVTQQLKQRVIETWVRPTDNRSDP